MRMCCNSFNIILKNTKRRRAVAKIYAKYQAAASPGGEFKFCMRSAKSSLLIRREIYVHEPGAQREIKI
jgi:hypothetical protein